MRSEILESFKWRYAVKKFDASKKIDSSDFEILLESLRLCCSSYGLQPWHFIVVENPALREKLVEKSYNQKQVAEASHLIVLCIKDKMTKEHVKAYVEDTAKTRGQKLSDLESFEKMMLGTIERRSDDENSAWMKDQVYIALGALLTTCAFLRIDSCPMEGFSPKGYDEVLDLKSKGLRACVVCPVGYRSPEDKYAQLEKVRFAKEKVISFL